MRWIQSGFWLKLCLLIVQVIMPVPASKKIPLPWSLTILLFVLKLLLLFVTLLHLHYIYIYIYVYLNLWSRGSVLTFGTQVRGFKSGRSLRIFKGEKILSTPSFGGEVKPSVPCRRFAVCKRSLELRGSRFLDEICRNISRPRRVPPSSARGLSRR
jgi:hypothetical protein